MEKAADIKELIGYSLTSFSIKLKSLCHLTFSSSNLLNKFLALFKIYSDFLNSFFKTSASPVFSPNTFLSPFTFSSITASSYSHSITLDFDESKSFSNLFSSF